MGKISIIVPVYKVEKYLDRCVESIVNQTYKNLEIILVDDGSPDNCPQMCDEWAKKDSRIKVIHKENGGVSSARNIGLDNATGEYIQFADSDDYLELNACELLINNMKETNADLIVANYKLISNFSKTKNINLKYFIESDYEIAFKTLIENNLYNALWNKLYVKRLIKSKFLVGQKYSEDFLFNCEYIFNCKKIVYIEEIVYNYFFNISSATQSFSEDCFKDQCKVFDYIDNKIRKKMDTNKIFLNHLQSDLILSSFFSLIKSNSIKYNQKQKFLRANIKSKYFKFALKNAGSFKRKVLGLLLKLRCINLIKFYFKLKGVL